MKPAKGEGSPNVIKAAADIDFGAF